MPVHLKKSCSTHLADTTDKRLESASKLSMPCGNVNDGNVWAEGLVPSCAGMTLYVILGDAANFLDNVRSFGNEGRGSRVFSQHYTEA